MELLTFALAAALACVHLFAGKLRFLDRIPRSRWLSFGSGISVAYVFVHLLPELAAGQEVFDKADAAWLAAIESHVWLMALLGLAVFYGLERAAKHSYHGNAGAPGADGIRGKVFWLHMGSFAIYNVLIGYLLLHRPDMEMSGLLLFWFAMLLHFMVNDEGLRDQYRGAYIGRGRWILAVAVLCGWLVGLAFDVGEAAVVVLLAFLGGGVVLNVMKEELPEDRQSSFGSFAAGAAAYAALLLTV